MRKSAKLIEQLIEIGRRRGLQAGDIAARAGISPTNLSRIRKTGRFNADTLERLLAAVDSEIRVTPYPQKQQLVLSAVTTKLNASRQERISAKELKRHLTRFHPSASTDRVFSHLVGVIEEIPVEQIHDLVIQGSATLPSLRRIVDYVDGEGPTVDWINEQATFTNELAEAS